MEPIEYQSTKYLHSAFGLWHWDLNVVANQSPLVYYTKARGHSDCIRRKPDIPITETL
jgi:hypothetical protein